MVQFYLSLALIIKLKFEFHILPYFTFLKYFSYIQFFLKKNQT